MTTIFLQPFNTSINLTLLCRKLYDWPSLAWQTRHASHAITVCNLRAQLTVNSNLTIRYDMFIVIIIFVYPTNLVTTQTMTDHTISFTSLSHYNLTTATAWCNVAILQLYATVWRTWILNYFYFVVFILLFFPRGFWLFYYRAMLAQSAVMRQ